ncbi:MAG TPA: bifunctional DNA-formamidopyrimidine glycosylase/DNA-(apurinic or apyrimidinic site) lyase [Gemmataceae bacterium]|nr:bifunctional DNA-formamidopyrimidine glycosylase/DNA-(apurinic or apyrimidinic site) lyase [Gemmataceae bacterium]
MPELPEVETVVRDLRPLVKGRTVKAVRRSKLNLRTPWQPAWDAQVIGRKFGGVRRRGKWIVMELSGRAGGVNPPVETSAKHRGVLTPRSPDPAALVVHLGMSGQFTVVPAGEAIPTHLHVVFELDNGTELRLRDQRRFGLARFHPSLDEALAELDASLGPEPFDYPAKQFRTAMAGTKKNLKAILLDQAVIAGVGNIYADEACFRAKLHPARTGASLSGDEADRLREAVELTLTRAIEGRGSTIRDYVGGSGLRGGFQNEHAVYGRTGEPCPACGTAVECVRLAGRASHFCPSCQLPVARRQLLKRRPGKRTGKRRAARTGDS